MQCTTPSSKAVIFCMTLSTKVAMLFQLNVGHKDATVSWLQMLFTITFKIYWSLGAIQYVLRALGNIRNSLRASPYILTVHSCY